jgi:hypothetical protein
MAKIGKKSSEFKFALYMVFSILSAFTMQVIVFSTMQSDLKIVMAVTGYLASFIFVVLSAGKPEVRVASSVKRWLSRDTQLLEFIGRCD